MFTDWYDNHYTYKQQLQSMIQILQLILVLISIGDGQLIAIGFLKDFTDIDMGAVYVYKKHQMIQVCIPTQTLTNAKEVSENFGYALFSGDILDNKFKR